MLLRLNGCYAVDCEQKCGNALGNFELFKILFNFKDFIEFFST